MQKTNHVSKNHVSKIRKSVMNSFIYGKNLYINQICCKKDN